MNCAECGRLLFANQSKCPCGWKAPERRAIPSQSRHADPKDCSIEAKRKFAKMLNEVDAYVARYLAVNRGSSQKDACFAYMRENRLMHILPASLCDNEAIEERAAIQAEGA